MSKLILVPTPIGNLKDITLRALEVLESAGLILAEDTRQTKKLLTHYSITTPLRSYHKFNERKSAAKIINEILCGTEIALVSDAGTPALSDPGLILIEECIEANIEVECLPGANALIPAIVMSGMPNRHFHFDGFLPVKKGRQTRLKHLATLRTTLALYESPHRLLRTLKDLLEFIGDVRLAVCREMTKLYHEVFRGTLSEAITHFEAKGVKGEFVLIIDNSGA